MLRESHAAVPRDVFERLRIEPDSDGPVRDLLHFARSAPNRRSPGDCHRLASIRILRSMKVLSTHVEVYLFRRQAGRVEFLVLRRSPDRRVLPKVWQPVTGKREDDETAHASAMREVREETGLTPKRWWSL